MAGLGLGCLILSSALVVVGVRWRSGIPLLLDMEEVLAGTVDSDVHLFVADVKSFDTVDRSNLDRGLE